MQRLLSVKCSKRAQNSSQFNNYLDNVEESTKASEEN